MTKIYGFGNALIDIEISLSDKVLSSLNINKGSMVHIGSRQKLQWLKQFKENIISKQPGGSIANAVHAATTENSICAFSCSVGDDQDKNIFFNGFNSDLTKLFYEHSEKTTGVCFIFVTPDGERTMASNLSANEDLLPKSLNDEYLSNCDWLLFDAFSVCTKNGFKTAKHAIRIAKKHNLKIAFGLADVNLMNSNQKEIKWVINQSIDLLFGNEIEMNLLKKSLRLEMDVLCSLGNKGSKFNEIHVPARDVSIINTNGAGDALLGVFLSNMENIDTKEALKKAVNYATKVCLSGGPRI